MKKTYCFFIPDRLPDMNEIVNIARMHRYASNELKQRYTNKVATLFKLKYRNFKPLEKVYFKFRWSEPHKRKDPDNIVAGKKFILDGLVKAGLLKNDGWKQVNGFIDTWEIGEPGVTVEIIEL